MEKTNYHMVQAASANLEVGLLRGLEPCQITRPYDGALLLPPET
jgi:hypothetical protein